MMLKVRSFFNEHIKPCPFWVLGTVIFVVNFVTMPRFFYVGDAQAVRLEAMQLVNHGKWGIGFKDKEKLGELAAVKGQYFFVNEEKKALFCKYGILNSLLFVFPVIAEKWVTGSVGKINGRSVFAHNVFNVFLSVLLAWFLFEIGKLFCVFAWQAAGYVLLAFYSTFLWFYLRAQTMEIFQVLCFSGLFLFFMRFLRGERKKTNLLLSSVFCGGLFLLKFYYGVLFLFIWGFVFFQERRSQSQWHQTAVWSVVPALIVGLFFLWVNTVKFGAAFDFGYAQWNDQGYLHDRFYWAGFFEGVKGFLFSMDRSVFVHFPLALLGLPGLWAFYRKFPRETMFVFSVFLFFLLAISCFSNWAGHACYGPRYLLFALPVLSLPLFEAPAVFLRARWGKTFVLAAGMTALGICLFSVKLQWRVNSFDFFTFYRLAGPFASYGIKEIDQYFENKHFGFINSDLSAYVKKGKSFYPLEKLLENVPLPKRDYTRVFVSGKLKEIAQRNYFFGDNV